MLAILGFLTGMAGPLSTIATSIANTKAAMAAAQTDQERNKLLAAVEELHGRQAVLIAEAGSRINAIIRGLFALPIALYFCKVFVFDKVLGSFLGHSSDGSMFTTDALGPDLWKLVLAVLAFYFLYDAAARWRSS